MGLHFSHKGDFKHTEKFCKLMKDVNFLKSIAEKYGPVGISALAAATPSDSGRTASLWGCTVEGSSRGLVVWWTNDNFNGSFNVAIGRQYGHGTGTGGYVPPIDYINPAMKTIFDAIASEIWRELAAL